MKTIVQLYFKIMCNPNLWKPPETVEELLVKLQDMMMLQKMLTNASSCSSES